MMPMQWLCEREGSQQSAYYNFGNSSNNLADDILCAAQGRYIGWDNKSYGSEEDRAKDKKAIGEQIESFLKDLRAWDKNQLVRIMAQVCFVARKWPPSDIRDSVFSIVISTESMLRGDLSREQMRALAKAAADLRERAELRSFMACALKKADAPDDNSRLHLWEMCGEIERAALRCECADKIESVKDVKEKKEKPLAAAIALTQFAERFSKMAADMQTKLNSMDEIISGKEQGDDKPEGV